MVLVPVESSRSSSVFALGVMKEITVVAPGAIPIYQDNTSSASSVIFLCLASLIGKTSLVGEEVKEEKLVVSSSKWYKLLMMDCTTRTYPKTIHRIFTVEEAVKDMNERKKNHSGSAAETRWWAVLEKLK